jgi:hypothetical protein
VLTQEVVLEGDGVHALFWARRPLDRPQWWKDRDADTAAPPVGGLPTRQVATTDESHPPVELVTIAATLERGWSSPADPGTSCEQLVVEASFSPEGDHLTWARAGVARWLVWKDLPSTCSVS